MVKNQKGFTLVELLLATAVFSIALIAITAAIIQIFKAYQSGISIRKTQSSARVISEELTRRARASESIASAGNAICFYMPAKKNEADGQNTNDAFMYYKTDDKKLMSINKQVTLPVGPPSCDAATFSSGSVSQVSDEEITVLKFKGDGTSEKMMELDMRLGTSTTDDSTEVDYTDPENPVCNPGYEYCSMTTIKKSIMARGGKE